VSLRHALEAALATGLIAAARRASWRSSLRLGARLGDVLRAAGVRRAVAEGNLAGVRPAWSAAERRDILVAHYRELGRVALEYARLAELARAGPGEVVAEASGLEVLQEALARGRGAVLMTGHYGFFELMGAVAARQVPVDFVVKPLSNPRVEAWIRREREAAGVGAIAVDEPRAIYARLRANRCVAMLADQDARRHGLFVPFLGRPASTATGPARIAIATGAAVIMGFVRRTADGRHAIEVEPALVTPRPDEAGGVERLTREHVRRLERRVVAAPEHWFWLHRRWKTAPPAAADGTSDRAAAASGAGG
jgi:KDO2-lipid IV(A) lauroyltransferase